MAKTLFAPFDDPAKLNPRFQHLRTAPSSEAARLMLDDVFQDFVDADGNFLEQFQTTGFDARFFELYLHAYFSRSGFKIDRSHPNPDFLVTRDQTTVAVEATTVNASTRGAVAEFGKKIADLTEEERKQYQEDELAIRFGSPLFTKLNERYWELPQCAGLPFVIALEAFHDQGSLDFTDTALAAYLYGLRHSARWDQDGQLIVESQQIATHKLGTKSIPSGFFSQPDTEFISAILFTNSGTSAKFTRMGYQSGYANDSLNIKRMGRAFNPDPDAMDSTLFSYDLDDPPLVETWGQGLVVLHNPNSRRPLPDHFFQPITQCRMEDGVYVPAFQQWHPYNSQTLITALGELKKQIPQGLRVYGPQAVAAISRDEFHDLCSTLPRKAGRGEEDGWYADQSNAFLGLVRRQSNGTWSCFIFARNQHFEWQRIAYQSGHRLRVLAAEAIQIRIMQLLHAPQRIFPHHASASKPPTKK